MSLFLIAIIVILAAAIFAPVISDAVCSTPLCPIATRPATLSAAADLADFTGWTFACPQLAQHPNAGLAFA